MLPVEVRGPSTFTQLAVWTVAGKGSPAYAAQVARVVDAYSAELKAGSAVLAGDLNCSPQTAAAGPHLANVARLHELGLESAYHLALDLAPGEEEVGTLYWRWQHDARFHCDLAFVPGSWGPGLRSVAVGRFEDWVATGVSDHVPLVTDVDVPAAAPT